MKKSIYFIFILFACQAITQESIEKISAEQLKTLQSQGVEIVDIRTSEEYEDGHIPNVPNIVYGSAEFTSLFEKKNKNASIIIHCASGGRSSRAAKQLIEMGFTKVHDYSGGFSDWKNRGEKIEK
ncbi:MAG: rhodanese-like domain-containing protein [Ekhidna sp.]